MNNPDDQGSEIRRALAEAEIARSDCEDNERLARLRQLVKDMDQWLE